VTGEVYLNEVVKLYVFTLRGKNAVLKSGLYLTGGAEGVEPPAKISDPLLLLKNARGVDFLCTYALARSSTSIAKTSTPPNEI